MINKLTKLLDSRYAYLYILFFEGVVSVSVQFLFLRHLLPYVGSSITVSSLVISIYLLFLSLGYYAAGRANDFYLSRLSGNLLKAALLITLGMSPVISELYFYFTGRIDNTASLIVYALLFLAPSVYWLGQTMPLLSNAVQSDIKAEISATVLFYSTIGNVVGGLFSVFVLIKFFGLGVAIAVNVSILLVLSVVCASEKRISVLSKSIALVFAVFVFVYYPYRAFDIANAYSNYKVINVSAKKSAELIKSFGESARIMIGNNVMQSGINIGKEGSFFPYVEKFRSFIRTLPEESRILVLGAGGYTLGEGDRVRKYVYVDIDPELQAYVEKYFLQKKINGDSVASDARKYLIVSKEMFDVIVLDTFSAKDAIPQHLVTAEYFALVKSRVRNGGYVLINTIQDGGFSNEKSNSLHMTINHVFPYCRVYGLSPDFRSGKPENVVYLCRNVDEALIYSDTKLNN